MSEPMELKVLFFNVKVQNYTQMLALPCTSQKLSRVTLSFSVRRRSQSSALQAHLAVTASTSATWRFLKPVLTDASRMKHFADETGSS